MEGTVIGRVGRDGDGKGWKGLRLEGTPVGRVPTLLEDDSDAVARSGRGSGRCWKRIRMQLLEVEDGWDVAG